MNEVHYSTDHVGIVLVYAHFGKWVEASHEAMAHVAVEEGERIGGVLAGLHGGDLRWRGGRGTRRGWACRALDHVDRMRRLDLVHGQEVFILWQAIRRAERKRRNIGTLSTLPL